MHIEIQDCDPLHPVVFQRLQRGHGDAVEKAEAHCALSLGMVPRRTHAAKCPLVLAPRDENYERALSKLQEAKAREAVRATFEVMFGTQ